MNQAVKTGLVAGVLIILLMVAEIFSPPGKLTAVIQFSYRIVLIAGTYIAIKRTRDIELPDEFPFRLGLKAGVTYGSIASIAMSIGLYIQMTNMDLHEFVREMERNGVNNSIIRQQLLLLNQSTMFKTALFLFTTNVVLTFLVSIAATLLLRKRNVTQ